MLNSPIGIFKYLDIISITFISLTIITLCMIFHKKEGNVLRTISETVAKNKNINLVYSVLMTIAVPIYYASALFYLSPRYNLPIIFDILIIAAFALEMLFIWTPANGKTASLHIKYALLVAIIMLLDMFFILIFGNGVGYITSLIIIIFLILSGVLGLCLKYSEKIRKKSFILEFVFLLIFVIIFILLQHCNI